MSPVAPGGPRIALIHALRESIDPVHDAFGSLWPKSEIFDLFDSSLSADLAFKGTLDDDIMQRFQTLADYVCAGSGRGGRVAGILFTCSAFGPAIEAVKNRLLLPVLRPNEAAFAEALDAGDTIGLIVSFGPSLAALSQELECMAKSRGQSITIKAAVADGALQALKNGDAEGHDSLVAEAARQIGPADRIILGQFSMARARPAAEKMTAVPIITTPHSAVQALKNCIGATLQAENKG